MPKRPLIMRKVAKILQSLDAGEEWDVCQHYLLMWFGPPRRFKKTLRKIRRFAKQYGCLLLFPEWSREPATFVKLERI
jgi:hypothetical protein